MKGVILATALLLSINTPAFASHYPTNLEGKYVCTGVDTESNSHSHFKGVVTLKKTGQTYALTGSFDDGTSYIGTGIYDQVKHIFSVADIDPKKPEELAISIAYVKQDGSMNSAFTYSNQTTIGHANCTKQ